MESNTQIATFEQQYTENFKSVVNVYYTQNSVLYEICIFFQALFAAETD